MTARDRPAGTDPLTGQHGQDRCDKTARTGQPGLVTPPGQPTQDNVDRSVWKDQPGTGQPGPISRESLARIGQPGTGQY
jgi:hypothetical protein